MKLMSMMILSLSAVHTQTVGFIFITIAGQSNTEPVGQANHIQHEYEQMEAARDRSTKRESLKFRTRKNEAAPTREEIISFIETESVFDR